MAQIFIVEFVEFFEPCEQLIVADTAKKAAQRGVEVMTYPEFISRALAGIPLKTGHETQAGKLRVAQEMVHGDYTLGLSPTDLL